MEFLTKSCPFEIKADPQTPGRFSGRASVYGVVDSYNDVVMPGAFAKYLAANGNRIKVLNQHDPCDVIGFADLTDSDTALMADGQLILDLQSGKDMEVRLKNKLIDGISIGYMVNDESYSNGVRQLKEITLFEISLVTFPANTFARVTDVKRREFVRRLKAAGAIDSSVADAIAAIDAQIDSLDDAFDDLMSMLGIPDPDEDDAAKSRRKVNRLLHSLKAGRTLSAANEQTLRDAVDAINRVLSQVDGDKSAQTDAASEKAALTTLLETVKSMRTQVTA